MKSSAAPVSATPFYYGWLILAATAVSEMLVQGATSYAAGLFVLPLQSGISHLARQRQQPVLIMFLGAALVVALRGQGSRPLSHSSGDIAGRRHIQPGAHGIAVSRLASG